MDRNKNLLIIGAGVYGLAAKEIAESMNCFEKICFLDDYAVKTPNGIDVIGKSSNLEDFAIDFANIIVAISDAEKRLQMISKIDEFAKEKLGIPTETLMERSGEAVVRAVRDAVAPGREVIILCGKGNNGGDGYAAATKLMSDYKVTVYDIFSKGQKNKQIPGREPRDL